MKRIAIFALGLSRYPSNGRLAGERVSPIDTCRAEFEPTIDNEHFPSTDAPEGMVWIPGGEFSMGIADPPALPFGGRESMADARPIHRVRVDGFWMDKFPVTNADFEKFIAETGYKTVAERQLDPDEFP